MQSNITAKRSLFSPSEVHVPKSSPAQLQAMGEALSPKTLSLIILPTEKCNFRCTYCYESFDIGKMSNETVEAIKKLIDSRMGDIDYLNLSWFGGEPLAAADIVLDIGEHAAKRCRQNNVKLTCVDVTTNGALLDAPLLDKLVACGQNRFQISLDGWREGHDETRRGGNGAATFELVWGSLQMLKASSHDIGVVIRIHLTDRNRDSVLELARHVKHEFGADERFSVFLKPIENLGGPQASAIKPLKGAERDAYMAALKQALAGTRGISSEELHKNSTYICYASKPNSLIIRANGRLAKCTVAFEDPKNDVGHIRPDGTLSIENSKLGFWFRGLHSRDADVLSCPVWVRPYESLPNQKVVKIAEIPA